MDLKEELANTSIQITCYDRNGELVKRVTSTDEGNVEDEEDESQNGSNQGTDPENPGGDDNGGDNGGGDNGGGGNPGNDWE